MDEREKIKDSEGFTIEVGDNYFGIEDAKKRLANNPNADVVLILISSPNDDEQCVALSLNQAEKLADNLQTLIKELKN